MADLILARCSEHQVHAEPESHRHWPPFFFRTDDRDMKRVWGWIAQEAIRPKSRVRYLTRDPFTIDWLMRLRVGTELPQPLTYAGRAIALAATYYGAALLGLHYASIGQSISLVWPPTGIAVAALTLLGSRYWPSIALGAFLPTLPRPYHSPLPP